jgi:transcriptional regulator with XRE-family HTH domain
MFKGEIKDVMKKPIYTALKELREGLRFKLYEVSAAGKLHQSYLSQLENGRINIGEDSEKKLIKAYKKLKIKVDLKSIILKTRAQVKRKKKK